MLSPAAIDSNILESDSSEDGPLCKLGILKAICVFGLLTDSCFSLFLQSLFSTILFQVEPFHKVIEKYYTGVRRDFEYAYFVVSILLFLGAVIILFGKRNTSILFQFMFLKAIFVAELFFFWWAFKPWFYTSIFVGCNPSVR